MLELGTLVSHFAAAMVTADAPRPTAINARSKEGFKPGIGPHSEAQTIALVVRELESSQPSLYEGRIGTGIAYPNTPRQKCDLCIGVAPVWEWAIEVKMLRILGDNGQVNDNILMHILSPYAEHRSAVTDCSKLLRSTLGHRKGILIFCYEASDWPLEPAILAFEALASRVAHLGRRERSTFAGLVHPVHSAGCVYAWEINPLDEVGPSVVVADGR
jgi:hypothetical protein